MLETGRLSSRHSNRSSNSWLWFLASRYMLHSIMICLIVRLAPQDGHMEGSSLTKESMSKSGVPYTESIDAGFYFSVFVIIRPMLDWLLYFIKFSFLYWLKVLPSLCWYKFNYVFSIFSRDICDIAFGGIWCYFFSERVSFLCIILKCIQ